LVVIVGPTAVGKTTLSIELAVALGGEVVSADSRLVYRGMDIGTAKPTVEERSRVPHHLIDIADPDQVVSVAQYQQSAYQAIDSIHQRGRIPFLVGGSGQYVRSVVQGWKVPPVVANPGLRSELEAQARQHGADSLHAQLVRLDPTGAARIDARNVRRVVRALEVFMTTGRSVGAQTKSPPPYRLYQVGFIRARPALYARIDERIDSMLRNGLVDEVRGLLDAGYGLELPSMSGLGYRQIGWYLTSKWTLDEAVSGMRRGTRRFARQQSTWFRADDPGIRWFDLACDDAAGVLRSVSRFLDLMPL
jgi:tRNA dimethylallyltransferase